MLRLRSRRCFRIRCDRKRWAHGQTLYYVGSKQSRHRYLRGLQVDPTPVSFARSAIAARQLLFFEKIVEGFARVVRAIGRGRAGCSSGGGYSGWRRVFLNRDAKRVETAFVAQVFLGDALRDGLGALELRGGIEMHALLAAVQLESAARTFAVGVKSRGEHRTAVRAAPARDGTDHARCARTNLFLRRTIFRWTLFFLLRGVRVHIAPMAILPLQINLRGKIFMILAIKPKGDRAR
jgi:hypothetical protein